MPLRPAKSRSGRGMLYSSGRVAHHRAVTLTSASRGCPGGHAGPTRLRHGVRCKEIHITEFGARQFYNLGPYCRKWSGAASGHRGWAAQGPGPIRAPDSGDDASLRGGPPPRTMGFIKGGWRSRSLSLMHWISIPPSSPALLSSSPATPPPLLCPYVADSTHPSGPAYHSAHSLLTPPSPPIPLPTPPSPPKSLPLRPTVAPHSLDRRELHEVPKSKKRRASCQGGIAQQSILPKRIGGAIGQSCKVFRDH